VSTIYDVAAAAGVNASTVSRALKTPQRVSAATRTRVQEAARKLNYKANVGASKLRGSRPRTIGVVLSGIDEPFKAEMLHEIERAAANHDCLVFISDARNSIKQERILGETLATTTDGLIFVESTLSNEDLLELGRQKDLVTVNRPVPGVAGILTAAGSGVADAVRYLGSAGHRSIAFVAEPALLLAGTADVHSLQEQCAWSGISVQLVACENRGTDGGRLAARAVKASACTAVLCSDDLIAVGLMHELQAAGIDVPKDISVIGWGNRECAPLTTPALSTIQTPGAKSGRAAVDTLAALWRQKASAPASCVLKTELIVRESSGPAPVAVS